MTPMTWPILPLATLQGHLPDSAKDLGQALAWLPVS